MSAVLHTPVRRQVLENGLTVLVKEQHASPVVAVLAHVNIGYFNEPDHWNGLSHVVEHMFFKGTSSRPCKEQIAEEVRALGGMINAGTYYDQTSYYIVAPSANVGPAIDILSDMFHNGLFSEDELAKELEVIIQESNQKRDSPAYVLLQSMYARAFDRHRIRRWRIGEDDTLRSLKRSDIVEFISATYCPGNVVLTVVGDVDTDQIIDLAQRHWSGIPRGDVLRDASPVEPPQMDLRYDRMTGPIAQRLVEFGFHVPGLLHPDSVPLSVLGAILSDGRSSRLYQSLKENARLANSVWAGYEGFCDIGVFTLGGDCIADDPLEMESALFEQVRKVWECPVDEDELRRVKTRLESRRLFMEEEVLGVARTLAYYEGALGDFRLADEMLERLKSVTREQVRRVAGDYLRPERATILEYLPESTIAPQRTVTQVRAALCQESQAPSASRTRRTRDNDVREGKLECGAVLVHRKRSDLPIVALYALFPGGRRMETVTNSGITSLMLKSSIKGTASWSGEAIANRIEGLGTGIGLTNGPDFFGFSLKVVQSRLEESLEVMREVVSAPLFDPEEVDREKQSIFGGIRRRRDSMSGQAMDLCVSALYGESPYGLSVTGREEAVKRLSAVDLKAWHSNWVRGKDAVIAAVGDIEFDDLAVLLGSLIPSGAQSGASAPPVQVLPPGRCAIEFDRQQTAAVMAFPGVSTYDDDVHALDLLAEITSGQAGRFFQAVRGDNSLAYSVSSFHSERRASGNFMTYTATSPEKEEEARAILLAECEKLTRETVGERELAGAKEAITGRQAISLQTFGAVAGDLAVNRLLGKPLNTTERYLDRVHTLTSDDVLRAAAAYLDPERIWHGVVRGRTT